MNKQLLKLKNKKNNLILSIKKKKKKKKYGLRGSNPSLHRVKVAS